MLFPNIKVGDWVVEEGWCVSGQPPAEHRWLHPGRS